jgi:hypothetical protein
MLLGVLVGTLLAACTETESTPATTPTMTAPTTTVPITTTTAPPPATSAPDRLAEIQAIFHDLEERRLDALYRGDVDAFSALFANEAYLERSLEAMERVTFDRQPAAFEVTVDVVHIDSESCLSLEVTRDFKSFLGPDGQASNSVALETSELGWGYSYETGSESWWDCAEPHPLDT